MGKSALWKAAATFFTASITCWFSCCVRGTKGVSASPSASSEKPPARSSVSPSPSFPSFVLDSATVSTITTVVRPSSEIYRLGYSLEAITRALSAAMASGVAGISLIRSSTTSVSPLP